MPILNYTTSIDAHKTVAEIQKTLVSHGAKNVSVDYDDNGNPAAITFMILFNEDYMNFRLPSRWQGVKKALLESSKVTRKLKTDEQAIRVAWRIIKDWCEAQLAIVEAELAEMPEAFFSYSVRPDGQTVYNMIKNNPRLLAQ